MKKIISAALILVLFAVCGCTPKTPETEPTLKPTEQVSLSPSAVTTLMPSPTIVPTTEAPTPAPTPTEAPLNKKAFVSGEVVNVREQATVESKRLTSLKRNTAVTIIRKVEDWSYIEYSKGKFGFMSSKYLSDSPVATPVATPKPAPTPSQIKYNSNIDINDNVFLDALEYTGYNLKKHRADGNMWVFILGSRKKSLGYLSGLGYDYGNSTGYETNSFGQPDIARFKARGGLVCASYLTYVYFNYLPNIAKINTSHLTRPVYPCSAQSWREAANDWVKKGLSRKISFTAKRYSSGIVSFSASESIPIGSIVVFKLAGSSDSSHARHVALYAGYAGGYNWLTHVGNERGPEMITIEHMGYGSTPEVPVEIITPPIDFSKYVDKN
ncbi:MAG: SH3 domain-containing protein [Clostridia bacterium]|nr:SH3 domain-containing protein [Clostridia bacterium]